jgi:hypothetical protein
MAALDPLSIQGLGRISRHQNHHARSEEAVIVADEAGIPGQGGALVELQGDERAVGTAADAIHPTHLHAPELDGVVLHEGADGGEAHLHQVAPEQVAVLEQDHESHQAQEGGEGEGITGQAG